MGDETFEYKRACDYIRQDLKECILNSDCVVKHNHHPNTCIREHPELVADYCKKLNFALYECKRSGFDTRRRFRGRRE